MYFVEIEVYCIISQTYAALSVFRTYITHGASFRCRGWDGCWGLGCLCRKGVLFFRYPVRPFLFDQVRLTSMTLCLCFLSGLWLVDPVLSKAKLVQVLINVAPMNLQKLSTKTLNKKSSLYWSFCRYWVYFIVHANRQCQPLLQFLRRHDRRLRTRKGWHSNVHRQLTGVQFFNHFLTIQ